MEHAVIMYHSAVVNRMLPKVMRLNHKTATQLGADMGYTQAMISKLRTGKGRLQFEQIQPLLDKLPNQNGLLMIDILSQISGGIIPPVVDEHYQLLDPGNLDNRVINETQQAIEAFRDSTDEFGRPAKSVADLHDPMNAFDQAYDVVKYVLPFMIAICSYFNWDIQKLATKREKVLKQNGYRIM